MASFDEILPITEVKKELLNLVKKVQQLRKSVAITRKGRPAAVLLSLEEYEGLLETVEIMGNPRLMKLLRKSGRESKKGKFYSHEEVWGI